MHHANVTERYNAPLLAALRADGESLHWDGPEDGRVVMAMNNWRDLEIGVIDGEAVSWFMYGNCGALALAMHDITGWDLVVLHGDAQATDPERTWIHVLVRNPAGELLDIEGAGDEANKSYLWRARTNLRFETTTRAEVVALLDGDLDDYSDLEREVVKDFARIVVS